jgi:hypothetical protein
LPLFHDDQTVGVRERQVLIAEACEQTSHLRNPRGVERLDAEVRERIEKGEKLGGSMPVVPAKKPSMSFGDNQG